MLPFRGAATHTAAVIPGPLAKRGSPESIPSACYMDSRAAASRARDDKRVGAQRYYKVINRCAEGGGSVLPSSLVRIRVF